MLKIKSIKFTNDPVFKNKKFDFTKADGNVADCVVIVGENGSGKTRLLKVLKQITLMIWNADIFKKNFDRETKKDDSVFLLDAEEYEIEYCYSLTDEEFENAKYFEYLDSLEKETELLKTIRSILKDKKYVIMKFFYNKTKFAHQNDQKNLNFRQIQLLDISESVLSKFDNSFEISASSAYTHNDPMDVTKKPFGNLFFNSNIEKTIFIDNKNLISLDSENYKKTIAKILNLKENLELAVSFENFRKWEAENFKNLNKEKNKDVSDIINSLDEFLTNQPDFEKRICDFYKMEVNEAYENYFPKAEKMQKIENFINSFNNFFSSKNEFKINNIGFSNVPFEKNGTIFDYSKLSTGEFFIINYSLNLLEQKPNLKENNYDELEMVRKEWEKINLEKRKLWNEKNNEIINLFHNLNKLNNIYLIDELDISLHPLWNKKILRFLKIVLENLYGQIFVTTHSELISFSINLNTDTLINMNDNNEEVSFKNYSSIQNFVEESLNTNYSEMIDETTVWLEGRTDKLILNFAKKHSNTIYPFNFRSSNNVKHEKNHNLEKINNLINGAVGVRTQFWSWVARDKINNKKPVIFIFDNDDNGEKYYSEIKDFINNNQEIKISNYLKLFPKSIPNSEIFDGCIFERKIQNENQSEFALILKYKEDKGTVESFYKKENGLLKVFESKEGWKASLKNILDDLEENKELTKKFKNCYSAYLDDLLSLIKNI